MMSLVFLQLDGKEGWVEDCFCKKESIAHILWIVLGNTSCNAIIFRKFEGVKMMNRS